MGLDAAIYCDCFERGLTSQPPAGTQVGLCDEGAVQLLNEDEHPHLWGAFDEWRCDRMCDHPGGYALSVRLGNIGTVGVIRHVLAATPSRYPILLEKVVYSGAHCGDFLSVEDARALAPEMHAMFRDKRDEWSKLPDNDRWLLCQFYEQMAALREVSLRLNKPIWF